MEQRWADVDRYISDLLVGPDPALDQALTDSAAAGLPPINVAPNQGKMLLLFARAIGARTILEIGTLGGYSTIWLARAVVPDGRVITLEIDPKYAEIARANVERAAVGDVVDIRVGPAVQTLAQLQGPFDLIFIDADKASYPEYLQASLELSRPGTLIIGDNVVRDGAVIDPSNEDPNIVGVRRFNEMLAAEPRVVATAIQTVGIKGYDGFAIALVT